jgi:hypothetical protein
MPSTKELQSQIDEHEETISEALEILQDSYTPEASRTDLVGAVADAIAVLSGEETEEDSTDEDEEGE